MSLRVVGSGMSTWNEAIASWGQYMTASACSVETIKQRTYYLRRVAGDLGGTPAEVTAQTLVAWLAAHDWAPNTLRAYRGALRAFYGFLMRRGDVEVSPAHQLPMVKVPRGRPRPAPEEAFRLAMRAGDDRARLAIMLAGVCGLRRGEITRTKREDLEEAIGGHVLRVVGKGGHVRLVPVPAELVREIHSREPGWLFPSPVTPGGHLTPHHLGKIVSRCLPDGLTTHTLRHRCGTVALEASGGNLRVVQELLGHAKPETTALYTEISGSALRSAVEGCL